MKALEKILASQILFCTSQSNQLDDSASPNSSQPRTGNENHSQNGTSNDAGHCVKILFHAREATKARVNQEGLSLSPHTSPKLTS